MTRLLPFCWLRHFLGSPQKFLCLNYSQAAAGTYTTFATYVGLQNTGLVGAALAGHIARAKAVLHVKKCNETAEAQGVSRNQNSDSLKSAAVLTLPRRGWQACKHVGGIDRNQSTVIDCCQSQPLSPSNNILIRWLRAGRTFRHLPGKMTCPRDRYHLLSRICDQLKPGHNRLRHRRPVSK